MICVHCHKEFEGAYCSDCWNRLAFGTQLKTENMEKWIQEMSYEAIYIKKDDGVKTPVAQVATPLGWQERERWATEALRKANLITASPVMLHALEMALFFMDENNEAYETVQIAIKLAKGEEDEE